MRSVRRKSGIGRTREPSQSDWCPLVLSMLFAVSCWSPQRLYGMEADLADFRDAVTCVERPLGHRSQACVSTAWQFQQFVSSNLDCERDSDCVVVSGIEPFEVDRLAVNRRIEADVGRYASELRKTCGDYDYFMDGDTRSMCKHGRCELNISPRSAIFAQHCDRARPKR